MLGRAGYTCVVPALHAALEGGAFCACILEFSLAEPILLRVLASGSAVGCLDGGRAMEVFGRLRLLR